MEIDLKDSSKFKISSKEGNYNSLNMVFKYDASMLEKIKNKKMIKDKNKSDDKYGIPYENYVPIKLIELDNGFKYVLLENKYLELKSTNSDQIQNYFEAYYYSGNVLVHYLDPNDSIVQSYIFSKNQPDDEDYKSKKSSFTPLIGSKNELAIIYNNEGTIYAQELDIKNKQINFYKLFSSKKNKSFKNSFVSTHYLQTHDSKNGNYYYLLNKNKSIIRIISQNVE